MDFILYGIIEGVHHTDNAVIVTATERVQGYKKNDGTRVNDKLLTFRVIFKTYFKKYIAEHFSANMYVRITGTMLPYALDRNGNTIEGFSLLGETINLATFQSSSVRRERRMIKESQERMEGTPDLDTYNQPDF